MLSTITTPDLAYPLTAYVLCGLVVAATLYLYSTRNVDLPHRTAKIRLAILTAVLAVFWPGLLILGLILSVPAGYEWAQRHIMGADRS